MKIKVAKAIVLDLNEYEADWLAKQMQSPLHGQHPDVEEERDKLMRHDFFTALSNTNPGE